MALGVVRRLLLSLEHGFVKLTDSVPFKIQTCAKTRVNKTVTRLMRARRWEGVFLVVSCDFVGQCFPWPFV